MKKNTLIVTFSLLLSTFAFAGPKSIYGEQGLKKVETAQDQQINTLSNGVCRVMDTEGKGCCTGFFIAEDLVMTNYHCMSCVHENADDRPWRSAVLTPFPIGSDVGRTQSIKMKTDDLSEINQTPELFAKIRMQIKTNDKSLGFSRQADVKIKKLLAGNKGLDFLIMKVERPAFSKTRVNTLSDMPLSGQQELITIGYPGRSPFPGEKVYDNTEECRVSQSYIMRVGQRYDNFGHQCDTNPGSSGSPIFDRFTGKVVGLHWGGGARRKMSPLKLAPLPLFMVPINPAPINFKPAKPLFSNENDSSLAQEETEEDDSYKNTQNKAVLMSSIIGFLQSNHPEIYEALNIQ